jgi:hypothetical protein
VSLHLTPRCAAADGCHESEQHPQRDGQAAAVDPNPWSCVDPLVAVDGGIGIGRREQVEEIVDVMRIVVGPIELEPAALCRPVCSQVVGERQGRSYPLLATSFQAVPQARAVYQGFVKNAV